VITVVAQAHGPRQSPTRPTTGVIARLQERGYSLAGIRDLLAAYDGGGDLLELLADPDLGLVEESPQLIGDAELAALTEGLDAQRVNRFTETGLVRLRRDCHCRRLARTHPICSSRKRKRDSVLTTSTPPAPQSSGPPGNPPPTSSKP
jgi:hypothetical protein